MAKTYDRIATTTLTATSTGISFTSITGTYTDLELRIAGEADLDNQRVVNIELNDNSNTDYGRQELYATTGGRTASAASSQTGARSFWVGGDLSTINVSFNSYTSTSGFKSIISHYAIYDGTGVNQTGGAVNTYRSTSAITKIFVYPTAGYWNTGTTMTLYGITAANA